MSRLIGAGVALMLVCVLLVRQWPDRLVHLIFCDVGQGDAILVTYGFQQLLIDGGRDEAVLLCLGNHMPLWDRTIELVVATHADADHVGGLPAVLHRYVVQQVLISRYNKETEVFKQLQDEIAHSLTMGAVVKPPFLGHQMRFSLEEQLPLHIFDPFITINTTEGGMGRINQTSSPLPVNFTILSPRDIMQLKNVENCLKHESTLSDSDCYFNQNLPEGSTHNDQSIVLFFEFGQVQALLMGDLENKGELALLASGLVDDVDILKVGHHGSKTASSNEFIMKVRPEVSVVSVGQNNRFRHPSPEVLNRLIYFESKVLRTDHQGTVEIVTNGKNWWVQ